MHQTFAKLNTNTKRDDLLNLSRFLINPKGFTLIELITSIAIIGILAAVGIQQYSEYKIRSYDAHSKQALHDLNLTCKAFWAINETSSDCDLARAKEYGFVQQIEVQANVISTSPENFCASAKHNKSPNTYTSDYVGVVSFNADCSNELAAQAEADRIAAEKAVAELEAPIKQAAAHRIAAEKAVAELEAAIKQAAREDCCIEVKWKTAEQSDEYNRRLKDSGCPNQTSEIVEACRLYFFNAEVASRRDPSIPNCPRIRFQFHSRNRIDALATVVINGVTVPAEGIHASQFDIDNPDSECARNL